MSERSVNGVFSQWFSEYIKLAYWVGRRFVRRRLDRKGSNYSASDVKELAQDAVCRGFDRFAKRCWKGLPAADDRKRWVCQCVVRGAFDATRNRSRFGSVSAPAAIRDDATARFRRIRPAARHGSDSERALLEPEYRPCPPIVTPEEVTQAADSLLPKAEWRLLAVLKANQDLDNEQLAKLYGCTSRTIRSRFIEIKEYLDPSLSWVWKIAQGLEAARRDTWQPWTTA